MRQVVRQKAGTVKLDLTQGDVVKGLHHFWSGGWIDLAKHTSLKRGNVLFFVDDSKLNMQKIFGECTWANVATNQRSALGAGAFNRARKFVQENPSRSVVALGDWGSLSRITIFAERELLGERLDQVLDHARWYEA